MGAGLKLKTFRKNTHGQFVVIAALLIAVLTLSVAFSVHQINMRRQQLRYQPVEELVLGITSDLDRCLTRSLGIATQLYQLNRSLGIESVTREGENFIFKWLRSVRASYAHLGINVTLSAPPEGSMPSPVSVKWTIDWGHSVGVSQVSTEFNLDVDAYGFKGWVGRSAKFVRLEILDITGNTVKFSIHEGTLYDSSPIPNLTAETLLGTRIHIDETFWASYPELEVTDLTYLGEGVYKVTFNHDVNRYTHGVELTVETPEDHIIVSALNYNEIKFTVDLQSQNSDSNVPTNLGQIEFDGVNYTLPHYDLIVSPSFHEVKYFPAEGCTFLNWTTTKNITATNPTHWTTYIEISGNGTITAFYTPQPTAVSVTLDSRDLNNLNNHLGNIILDTITYAGLPKTNNTLTAGKYYIEYIPDNPNYHFLRWESENFIFDDNSAQYTMVTVHGDGTITAVYSTTEPQIPPAFVNMTSQEENAKAPTNRGLIQLGGNNYTLPVYSLETKSETKYYLRFFPEKGYEFLNWTTTGDVSVEDSFRALTEVTINGNGSIKAFYRDYKINLNSRQWENSSFNLGNITLGATVYTLPHLTDVAGGTYQLKYMPENSSYQFLWWEWSGNVIPDNRTSPDTNLEIYGDGTVTAVYSLVPQPPPSPSEEWDLLYFCDLPPTMLLPFDMLPQHYFNPRSSTLPIPPRDSWQRIDVRTPPTEKNMTLAKYVNITIYIQLASDKAENITLELKFTYNNITYFIGNHTFNVLVGEGAWYTHTFDTDAVNKINWPVPFEPIIPQGSTIIMTIIIPPNSGTLHIVYGWDRYQSVIDMFK